MTFEEWTEQHEDELWIRYHESLACYDTEYETWLERQYARQVDIPRQGGGHDEQRH